MPELPKAPPISEAMVPRASTTGRRIAIIIGIKVVVVVVVLIARVTGAEHTAGAPDQSTTRTAGACLKGDVADAKTVADSPCGPEATYQVLGVVENQSSVTFGLTDDLCAAFPTAGAAYFEPKYATFGSVLCLADLKRPVEPLPATGNCVQGDVADPATMKKVECGPQAGYRVAGVEKGDSLSALLHDSCTSFPETGAAYMRPRLVGVANTWVVCLADLRNPNKRRPVVGECLEAAGEDVGGVVECGPRARYRVLGRIDNTTTIDQIKPVKEVCGAYPSADQFVSWHFEKSTAGTTFCVKTL